MVGIARLSATSMRRHGKNICSPLRLLVARMTTSIAAHSILLHVAIDGIDRVLELHRLVIVDLEDRPRREAKLSRGTRVTRTLR